MNNEFFRELEIEIAEQKKKEYQEELIHPLSKYSTAQLKAELRRRKGEKA
jgi:hypothetical protein